jgi:hypothetical protein
MENTRVSDRAAAGACKKIDTVLQLHEYGDGMQATWQLVNGTMEKENSSE